MGTAIVNILENYGIAGLSLFLSVGLLFLFFKLEKRVSSVEALDNETSKMCDKRSKYFSESFDRLDEIEKKDVASDGRFDTIDNELKNLNKSVDGISSDVKTILNHFASKGMG